MKTLSMLMMAAFTLISIHSFGQHKDGKDSTQQKQLYSCPMKCEGDKTYDKPGKCPKCGMALMALPKEKITTKTYTCPMHADVTSDKPGKCPKCGMDLREKKLAAVAYICPMKCEGDKTYDKPGNCPKCGMALKEQKDDHSDHRH